MSFVLILFLILYYVAPFGSYGLNNTPLSKDSAAHYSLVSQTQTNPEITGYLNPTIGSGSDLQTLDFLDNIKPNTPATINTQNIQAVLTNFKAIGMQMSARNIQEYQSKPNTYHIQSASLQDTVLSAKYNLDTDMLSELTIDNKLYEVSINRLELSAYLTKMQSETDFMHDTIQAISQNVSSNEEIINLQQQNIKNEMSKWDIYVQPRNIQPIDESNNIFQIANAKVLNTLVNFRYDKNQNTVSEILLIDDNIALADSLEPADILLEIENILLQKDRLNSGFNGIQKKFKSYGFIVPANALSYANNSLKIIQFEKMSSEIISNGPQISGLFDSNQDIFIDVQWPSGVTVNNLSLSELQEEYARQIILADLQELDFAIETLEISGSVHTQLRLSDFVMGNFLLDCSFTPSTQLCGNIMINKHPLKLQKESIRLDQLAAIMRGIIEVDTQKKERAKSQSTK